MDITRDEFYRAIGDLKGNIQDVKTDLKEDIHGVHERLDTQNGRLGKSEIKVAELTVIVARVDAEMLRIRRDDAEDTAVAMIRQRRHQAPVAPVAEAVAASKDVRRLLAGGLVALTVALRIIELLAVKVWELMTHKP